MEKLLIVDDSEDIRKQMKWGLAKDYDVSLAANREEAVAFVRKHRPRVVTLDLGLPPDADGTSEGFLTLEEILRLEPTTKVIVVTGNDERESALRAVRTGAYDFYRKPIEIAELKVVISRAFHIQAIEVENRRLQIAVENKTSQFGGIIGQCPQMEQVFATIKKVASTDVPVFVTGESGTGKELVAKAIHTLSLRKEKPFIPINCGAIPENLLEPELFGHEKGAFTGAHVRSLGKVEYAHHGTLFLDEIGELPLGLQVKLLRFLQEKVIQRVGGREDIPVDARVVSATNVDIAKAIQEGSFREDLFYRTAVITIHLPPLRERGNDILLLANLFLRRFSEGHNKKIKGFAPATIEQLLAFDWPGNVRELENRVQRAVIMGDSAFLEPSDLGFESKTAATASEAAATAMTAMTVPANITLKEARDRVERDLITNVLHEQDGNIAKASQVLGVSRPTLYDLMKKHGMEQ
ncbi:MAG: PEP-CTERM-box response regulator transcription factor [Deltaproteobacteria bacterium]|nr:PEP-CTERM-box response regulator transcription factor [Deltaproteobacteria bacterium]TLN01638.1 MAG: PEP-CTERM-box response regulator transcription factor [bacterium]